MKQKLRLDVDSILKKYQHSPDAEAQAITNLIHELSVYQIELEMQNQSLKEAQEELLQSNINFFNLYNEAPVGYVILDKQDRVMKANKAFLSMINISADKVIGQPLVHAFVGDSRLILAKWLGSHLMGDNAVDLTLNLAGQTHYFQVATNEFNDFEGKACRLLVFTDVTHEVNLEKRLELSFEITNTSKEACLVIDEDRAVHFVNTAFEKLTGYDARDLISLPIERLKSNRSFLNFDNVLSKLALRDTWTGPVWMLAAEDVTLSAHVEASRINCGASDYIVFRFNQVNHQD